MTKMSIFNLFIFACYYLNNKKNERKGSSLPFKQKHNFDLKNFKRSADSKTKNF